VATAGGRIAALRELLPALLGLSAYSKGRGFGPDLDSPQVVTVRESQGGNLAPWPTTKIRWYLADLETAQHNADAGNFRLAAQICRAMRRDGTISGLLETLASGVVRLPKKFYGSDQSVSALRARNGSRSVFDDMIPTSESSLLVDDGAHLGMGIAELVPVPGRDFPILIRLEPEFLQFRWNENRWYYLSIAGALPITPGDGRWVLHCPGGRQAPWMSGKWMATGRAFINKEHALLHRSNYIAKLANAARAATSSVGASEPEREGMIRKLIAWGMNTVFDLPVGWDVKLIESNGVGYQVFQADIDTSDREVAMAVAGQVVSAGDAPTGFIKGDLYETIRGDILEKHAMGYAYTVNTQVLPQFNALRFGEDALNDGAILELDSSKPKDLQAQASAFVTASDSFSKIQEAFDEIAKLTGTPRKILDLNELVTRFGIPTIEDVRAPNEETDRHVNMAPVDIAAVRERLYRDRGYFRVERDAA
jgi:hypothetical protein